jgi:mannosyl-oligosaccharide alpha-1,2-mannosidase
VLNTEAHPFPRFDASRKRFKTGWKRIPRDAKGELIRPKEAEKKEDGEKEDGEKREPKVEPKKEVTEEQSKGKVSKKARVMRVPKVDKVN